MSIEGINGFIKPIAVEKPTSKGNGMAFGDVLGDFVKQVNQDQLTSNRMISDFTTGNNGVELHEVMVAGEKAKTSFELLMQIRNKTIDMYKELSKI